MWGSPASCRCERLQGRFRAPLRSRPGVRPATTPATSPRRRPSSIRAASDCRRPLQRHTLERVAESDPASVGRPHRTASRSRHSSKAGAVREATQIPPTEPSSKATLVPSADQAARAEAPPKPGVPSNRRNPVPSAFATKSAEDHRCRPRRRAFRPVPLPSHRLAHLLSRSRRGRRDRQLRRVQRRSHVPNLRLRSNHGLTTARSAARSTPRSRSRSAWATPGPTPRSDHSPPGCG